MKLTQKKKEMYMASEKMLCLGPKATYIPVAGVGSAMLGVGSARLFGYQHVGILGDSPTSHSRSYQLQMLMPCRQQAAPGGQNVFGGLLTLTAFWLVLGLSVCPVSENR